MGHTLVLATACTYIARLVSTVSDSLTFPFPQQYKLLLFFLPFFHSPLACKFNKFTVLDKNVKVLASMLRATTGRVILYAYLYRSGSMGRGPSLDRGVLA